MVIYEFADMKYLGKIEPNRDYTVGPLSLPSTRHELTQPAGNNMGMHQRRIAGESM